MSVAISALSAKRSTRWIVLSLAVLMSANMWAGQFRLSLPKRTKPTPVQKLNQDGVKACQKHDYAKAKKLFYKAYLIDPNDPFTLNNLGYIAELDGDLERAQRYYTLSQEYSSDALVYKSSDKKAEGKTVSQIAGNAQDREMNVNRLNVEAMGLLMKDRAPEADVTLTRALALDPQNPFTLNNLGFAKEKEGELEQAVRYYTLAANTNSEEPVVVTVKKDWRGRPISRVAGDNAKAARKELDRSEDYSAKVTRYNLRGVSALNRNDRRLARQYFEQAYKLDPNNAFTLNNMGYVAELDGDRETADWFYSKAQSADRSGRKVAVATRRDAEGMPVSAVAVTNDQTVGQAQEAAVEAKRRKGGEPALMRRDNTKVVEEGAAPIRRTPRRADSSEVAIPDQPAVASPTNDQSAPQNDQAVPQTQAAPEQTNPQGAQGTTSAPPTATGTTSAPPTGAPDDQLAQPVQPSQTGVTPNAQGQQQSQPVPQNQAPQTVPPQTTVPQTNPPNTQPNATQPTTSPQTVPDGTQNPK
jgi:Flp pilus assembly protein TadD